MVEKLLLPFPLLSDPEGGVIRDWGVWNDADGGLAKPAIFAIRRDGSVGWSFTVRDFADRPTDDELFNLLRGGVLNGAGRSTFGVGAVGAVHEGRQGRR